MNELPRTDAADPLPPPAIELERAIGYNSGYGNCTSSPLSNDVFYALGGTVVQQTERGEDVDQSLIRGTEERLSLIKLSESGRLLITVQGSGKNPDTICWDMSSKKILFRLTEHESGVSAVDLSRDEKLLLTVGDCNDKRIIISDVSSGQIVNQTSLPKTDDNPTVTCAVWGGQIEDLKRRKTSEYQFCILSGQHFYRYKFNPMTSDNIIQQRTSLGGVVRNWTSAVYSLFGDLVFLGTDSGDVAVVSTTESSVCKTESLLKSSVRYLALSSDDHNKDNQHSESHFQYARFGDHAKRSSTIIAGGTCGTVVVAKITDHGNITFSIIARFQLNHSVNSISTLPDGELLCGTSKGEITKAIPMATNNRNSKIEYSTKRLVSAPYGSVKCLSFVNTESSDTIISGSTDGVVRVWDLSSYSVTCSGVQRQTNSGTPLCIAPVGFTDTCITGWSDGGIRCYDTSDGELHWELPNSHQGECTNIVISESLMFFITSGEHGEIKIWNMKTHQLMSELKEHRGRITTLELFKDETHLLSTSKDRSLIVWNLQTGQRPATNMLPMGQINSAFIRNDQTSIMSTGTDRMVSLWDLRQHEPTRQVSFGTKFEDSTANTISPSHCGRYFATGGTNQAVTLWDGNSIKPIQSGIAHTSSINQVLFSPDDRQLLSCGEDQSIMVWNFYPAE